MRKILFASLAVGALGTAAALLASSPAAAQSGSPAPADPAAPAATLAPATGNTGSVAPAAASGPGQGGWLGLAEVSQAVAAQGYTVRGIEPKRTGYEVKAVDPQGRRVELMVDPLTAAILGFESDD